jgi:hypothetical protein
MLKKARHLTRPTLAATSPAIPESAKTASLPEDAPFPKQGRTELSSIRDGWDDPNCARLPNPQFIFKGGLVDPRLRASNEHILIVRVPRAGGRPGYPALFFSILLEIVARIPVRLPTLLHQDQLFQLSRRHRVQKPGRLRQYHPTSPVKHIDRVG